MAALIDEVRRIREERERRGEPIVPSQLQGVTKERVAEVLDKLNIRHPDIIGVVFALLDDNLATFYSRAPDGAKLCDGASTAHIFAHVGVLQGGEFKKDREQRDQYIKPLRDLGAIEAIYLNPATLEFDHGHPVSNSPNLCYRLHKEFVEILKANNWQDRLTVWTSEARVRQRKQFEAVMAEKTRLRVDTKHDDLIESSVENYVPRFLPGYDVIFRDAGEGTRVTDADRNVLAEAGLEIVRGEAMPDVLLWNPETDWIWVIEAVTSDGEVDLHKQKRLTDFAVRYGKAGIGFTTTYQTWKRAAARQKATDTNIAPGTYIWIEESPAVHLLVKAFDTSQ